MSELIIPPQIVVPSHLRKLYESAMKLYDETKALETAENICDNIDDFEPDSLKLMSVAQQKRRFAADQMTDAMNLECVPCSIKIDRYGLVQRHVLNISELKNGACNTCKTPIVLEWRMV